MESDLLLRILQFYPIFLFSLTIHEIAHALTANWGGDMTATYQNRLSLNPVVHMDLFGTVIIPLLPMFLSTGGIALFGWARPVPVNEARFRDTAWNVVVALAGPFSNLLLVLFGTLLMGFAYNVGVWGELGGWWVLSDELLASFATFVYFFVAINFALCIFNLIPVPPLDGSHVFYHFFVRGRGHLYGAWDIYQRLGIFILIVVVQIVPHGLFGAPIRAAFKLLTPEMAYGLFGIV